MIRIGLLICLTAYFPITANAETYATITKITPNYTYSKSYKKEKSCYTVDTPIYGNTTSRGTAGGDVFTGMLLGSLLGKVPQEKIRVLWSAQYWEVLLLQTKVIQKLPS